MIADISLNDWNSGQAFVNITDVMFIECDPDSLTEFGSSGGLTEMSVNLASAFLILMF